MADHDGPDGVRSPRRFGRQRSFPVSAAFTKDGAPKIVKKCTYPLTGLECVDTVITDLAVVDVSPEGLVLREVAPGWRPQDVQKLTGAPLMTKGRVPEIRLP